MRRNGVGTALAVLGFLSIIVGLFSGIGRCAVAGAICPSPRPSEILAYGGLVVLVAGVLVLISSGWQGSVVSWVVAAVATFPATWTIYEIARQGPCLTVAGGIPLLMCNAIPFGLGQAGAPISSSSPLPSCWLAA